MTPESQRIAIATECKWGASGLHETDHSYEHGMFVTPDGVWVGDPTKDLNSIHEVEKVLTNEERNTYGAYLMDSGCGLTAFATAAQRAEAFLRTLNLWKD